MLTMRVPRQLIDKLDRAAEANRRSRSAEAELRLEKSLAGERLAGARA